MLEILIVQSILSALVFAFKRPRHLSNYMLTAWFLINGLNFVGMVLPQGLAAYIKIGYIPFLFLNGPIFYFYVQSLIKINFRFKWIHTLHLLPFVAVSIYRLLSISESVHPSEFYHLQMPPKYLVIYSLISLSIISYLTIIFRQLIQHKKNIDNYFAQRSQKNSLDWILAVIIIFSVSSIFNYYAPLLPGLQHTDGNSVFWFNQFNLGMLGFLLLIVGLMQPAIFVQQPVNPEERKEENTKYQRSGLNKEQLARISNSILTYIENQKPYLNTEYSLEIMARDLNITRQNLSQAINDDLNKNFYQLINEYRVAEFKSLLNNPEMKYLTFTGLAYEAGFNSKSAFYRVFKEITGETPTEYQKKQIRQV